MPARHTPESFWKRVKRGAPNACWPWMGCCNSGGYGTITYQGEHCVAHRVAAYLRGKVKSPSTGRTRTDPVCKVSVLHRCDNRRCCNPRHLEVGTYGKNQADAYKRKRRAQPQGSKHANAKLTRRQAHRVRQQYKQGISQDKLAVLYSVSQRVISLVVRNLTYRE